MDKITENGINTILENYVDNIMRFTLGSYEDEYEERYAEVYKWEWEEYKQSVSYTIAKLINNGYEISSIGLAYIIVAEWSGVMTFSEGDLDIEGLKVVGDCILKEIDLLIN